MEHPGDEQTFIIEGADKNHPMDCADCARTLERSLAGLKGVQTVQVNFLTARLQLRGVASVEDIQRRVSALGYRANPLGAALAAPPPAPSDAGRSRGLPARLLNFIRFLAASRANLAALLGGALLLAAAPVGWAGWDGLAAALHVGVALLAGTPIALKGLRALIWARRITIDLLMGIAAAGALAIGETGEAAAVIILFAIGEALEGYTAERARHSLHALLALRPDQAAVLRPCMDCAEHRGQAGYHGGPCPFCGEHESRLPLAQVAVGERVLVKPGERIPLDGVVLKGYSAVNQAPVTGESMPAPKQPGDSVFAGSVNGEAALEISVTRPASDSTLNRIIRLVEQAQAQRAPVERFVDRFAAWYTPAVVVAALLLAAAPPLLFDQPFLDTPTERGWLYRALALLIVACPCALVISTPVTMVSALTGLARRGVLVKGGQFLDALARVRTFAFDKTGTLTLGSPAVRQTLTLDCPPQAERCPACDDMLALAAAVESRSTHPLAQAILAEAAARQVAHAYPAAEAVQDMAGRGVSGVTHGAVITVGSHALFHAHNGCGDDGPGRRLHAAIEAAEAAGQTVMLVGKDDPNSAERRVLGFVGAADRPRPDSGAALRALKALDRRLHTVMLTGDNPVVAAHIAAEINAAAGSQVIDTVRAGLLPEHKLEAVRALSREAGPVAMVGDGVNDAPALAAASVGIAMGGAGTAGAGTAQAMETADLVLMQDNLARLPEALRASRKAQTIIWQNILFSLAIKALFLLLALPGWATLWMAVFADTGASLLVTANGLRARQ